MARYAVQSLVMQVKFIYERSAEVIISRERNNIFIGGGRLCRRSSPERLKLLLSKP